MEGVLEASHVVGPAVLLCQCAVADRRVAAPAPQALCIFAETQPLLRHETHRRCTVRLTLTTPASSSRLAPWQDDCSEEEEGPAEERNSPGCHFPPSAVLQAPPKTLATGFLQPMQMESGSGANSLSNRVFQLGADGLRTVSLCQSPQGDFLLIVRLRDQPDPPLNFAHRPSLSADQRYPESIARTNHFRKPPPLLSLACQSSASEHDAADPRRISVWGAHTLELHAAL